MGTGEINRAKSAACLREAEKMHGLAERLVMLEIARVYLNLADHVERRRGDGLTADEKGPGLALVGGRDRGSVTTALRSSRTRPQ